jgi:uncharacterized protein YjbI with pentapeptide repeats
MRIIKPLQLSLVTRPFEYKSRAYLGFSIISGVPLGKDLEMLQETELWQRVLPQLGEDAILDAGIPKRRGEFLVMGNAHAPGEPVESMRIRVDVGECTKVLNIFGDRYFDGDRISRPKPFEVMPIDWRFSFGGEGFDRNPLGKGMHKLDDGPHAGCWPLPNIENPDQPVGLRGQRPDPAGLGPLDLSWPQRRRLAGTYDDAWLKSRFPGFPDDIRWEHFNMACPDQWRDECWTGGERFRIEGMHADHPVLEGEIPRLVTRCFYKLRHDQALHEARTVLSTLWFMPEAELLVLIYQGSIGVNEYDAHDIESLLLGAEFPEQTRTVDHYQTIMSRRTDPGDNMLDLVRDEPLMPTGLARSVIADALGQLADEDDSPLVRNIESTLDAAFVEARKKTQESGLEFPAYAVPRHDPSLKMPDPDGIEAFLDEKYQLMYDTMAEAYELRDEARERARQELERHPELGLSVDDLLDENQEAGPPKFSAQAKRDELQSQCEQMQANGSVPVQLQSMANDPAVFKQWEDAERNLKDLYRMGAHYQKPVAPVKDSAARVNRLINMLANNRSVAGWDFCGVDLSGLDLSGRDLSGVFLESATLTRTNLSGSNLSGAVLAHAHLRETNLEGANLDEANLGKASLIQVRARDASLCETVLESARIGDSDFSGASISGMQVFFQARIRRCDFTGVKCKDLVFMEMGLGGCKFPDSTFNRVIFLQSSLGNTNWQRAALGKAVFVACSGRKADFGQASLLKAIFVKDCDFSECNFQSANLGFSNWRGTNLLNCDFSHSRLDQADFSETNAGGSSFRQSIGPASRWVRSDLRECDLSGANRAESVFHRADLRSATLVRANLHSADLARITVDSNTRIDGALTTRMNIYPRLQDQGHHDDH